MSGNGMTIAKLLCGPFGVALLLISAMPASAITLDSYKAKIDSARRLALRLENSLRLDETDNSLRLELVTEVRRNFPHAERVEWEGGTAETANDWLLDRVKAIDSETEAGALLSNVVVIREYLSAVLYKIEEVQQALSAGDRTKDEDKQKLAEILQRDEYQKSTQKEESLFQRLWRQILEWLAELFPKTNAPTSGFSGFGVIASILRVMLYIAVFGLLLFLVYKIAQLFVPALAQRRKPGKKKDRIILGERLGENETASDLFGEAERLAREGNLRGAIRKGYIALLCELSDRRVIGLARSKTNRDYLRDVRSHAELYPRMKVATDTFELHWYGSQESAETDWSRFRDEYQDAIRSV